MPRRFRHSIALMILMLSLGASYFLYMDEQGNFHPITDREAYRSAILDRDELEHYIETYQIRSIVNLLGEHPRDAWYADERDVSERHRVKHYDISLDAHREPTKEELRELMIIFETAPRPVLFHCRKGADRSGLVAAMWKVIVNKKTKSEAMKELSILYGHIPVGKTIAMDRFFEKWDPALLDNANSL
jgi:protein tyrosine/serine phosphatase